MAGLQIHTIRTLYESTRRWFAIIPAFFFYPTFYYDAPFGRFSPATRTIFTVDGIYSWIAMELVALVAFSNSYLRSPLSATSNLALTSETGIFPNAPPLSLTHPPTLIAALFVTHYLNRSLISPLRTPSRSKSHLMVAVSAVVFNTINGSLMGTYLSSPSAQAFLSDAFSRPTFWLGLGLWAVGFAGNIAHDEILLNIRRNVKKTKPSSSSDANNGKDKPQQEHYAIPYGLLYRYVSYPNYFCEWVEWLGFALVASPAPSFGSVGAYISTVSPPWLFFFNEILVMLPRAYKGHEWYHNKFPNYPLDRKVVVPFLY